MEDDEISLVGDCEDGDPEEFRYHFGTGYDDGGRVVWFWWTVDFEFIRMLNRSRHHQLPVDYIPDHVHGPYDSKDTLDKYVRAAKVTMAARRGGIDRSYFFERVKDVINRTFGGACCVTSNTNNVMLEHLGPFGTGTGSFYVHVMKAWPLGADGSKQKSKMRHCAAEQVCKWSRDVGLFSRRGFTHPVYSANHYCTANATKSACTGITIATFELPTDTIEEANKIASDLLDLV